MVKNRKFINEENKLKCLLQMRKKEEIEQLKEKAEQQRKSRLKTKEINTINTTKDKSLNKSLNRNNTSKSPIHNNFNNNCLEKPLARLMNSKSNSRILEGSFAADRSFSRTSSRLLNNGNNEKNKNYNVSKGAYEKNDLIANCNKNISNSNDGDLNNTISVINNNSNNILHSKIVFGDESSVKTKNLSNIGDVIDKNINNNLNHKKEINFGKEKITEESKKERKNYSITNKNTGVFKTQDKYQNDCIETENFEIKSRENNQSLISNQMPAYVKKNNNGIKARKISCNSNTNSNININIINKNESHRKANINENNNNYIKDSIRNNKLNSNRFSSVNNKDDKLKGNAKKNNINNSIDSKIYNNSKYNQSNIDNSIIHINKNEKNLINENSSLDNCSEYPNKQRKHKSKNYENEKNFNNNKDSLSYKLYNELKNIKKNLNSENFDNNLRRKENVISIRKNDLNDEYSKNPNNRNNLSKSKSTERLTKRNHLNNTFTMQDNLNNSIADKKSHVAKISLEKNTINRNDFHKPRVNSTVGFAAKNDHILNNIIHNIKNKYQNNSIILDDKLKDSQEKQSKNSVVFDYEAELEKEIIDNYKQANNEKEIYENDKNKVIYDKRDNDHFELKNEAYTLGRNESYPIADESYANINEVKHLNTNDYISKITGDMNLYRREYDITKITDVKQKKKVIFNVFV